MLVLGGHSVGLTCLILIDKTLNLNSNSMNSPLLDWIFFIVEMP